MINLIVGDGKIAPGSCYLSDTPALAQHHGSQPDLFLSWTAIDLAAPSVDVIVYFHGFAVSGEKQAPLSDFVKVSGLDLMKGGESLADRKRPTIAIVPRGNASPEASPSTPFWPYRFPALFGGGADRLVADTLKAFASARKQQGGPDENIGCDRLILMGHSGGGKAVVGVLPGLATPADEVYLFDALYDDPRPALSNWIATLIGDYPAEDRRMCIRYLGGTAPLSKAVQAACATAVGGAPDAKQAGLRKCSVVEEAKGEHMEVPRRYARGLLATGDAAANV